MRGGEEPRVAEKTGRPGQAHPGLYLVKDSQFGERDGNALLSIAVIISVGLTALVSPILGAISDRGGRRIPFLLFFTAVCIGATFFIANVPAIRHLRGPNALIASLTKATSKAPDR